MRRFTGLRGGLIAWFAAIFAISLVGFSAVLYWSFERSHRNEFDASLYNYAVDISDTLETNVFGLPAFDPHSPVISRKIFPFLPKDSLLELRSISGEPLYRSEQLEGWHLPFSREDRDRLLLERAFFRDLSIDQLNETPRERVRMITFLIDRPGPEDFVLQVAAPMKHWKKERGGILTFFFTSIPAVLILALLGGLVISSRALAPMHAIVRKARSIGSDNLSDRVPLPNTEDEIRELAETLNGLLARLEQDFQTQEQFIADASHQLKTPLAIINGELEYLALGERSAKDVDQGLGEIRREVQGLIRTVNNLLLLARAGLGQAGLTNSQVRVDEVALEVASRVERLARQRQIRIKLDMFTEEGAEASAFEVFGDSELLRCLFENLIENGVKYSPDQSVVRVELKDSRDLVLLKVSDAGPGVAMEDREKIFERFHRGRSVQGAVSGSGLGLAIAKKIADAHGGRIGVETAETGGALFYVSLPKVCGIRRV